MLFISGGIRWCWIGVGPGIAGENDTSRPATQSSIIALMNNHFKGTLQSRPHRALRFLEHNQSRDHRLTSYRSSFTGLKGTMSVSRNRAPKDLPVFFLPSFASLHQPLHCSTPDTPTGVLSRTFTRRRRIWIKTYMCTSSPIKRICFFLEATMGMESTTAKFPHDPHRIPEPEPARRTLHKHS